MLKTLRRDIIDIYRRGLEAVAPDAAVKTFCRRDGDVLWVDGRPHDLNAYEHVYVVGAGKAGAPMAAALEFLLGDRLTEGVVVVKYGHTLPLHRVRLVEAGHPVPDENGIGGAKDVLNLAKKAGERDLILCVISGGGSALLPLPAPGISLADKQSTIRVLMPCGATIHEINTIRKHMSAIKGGNLAKTAYPAEIITLVLSDVVGDDPDIIASGPTVPDTGTFSDCRSIFRQYDLRRNLPRSVILRMDAGESETPKIGDPAFEKARYVIVGSNSQAVHAAEKKAVELGYHTIVLSSMIEGETRMVAGVHAAVVKEILKTGKPIPPPACVISGGETTVTIKGRGKGGRNQEFALAAAVSLAGVGDVVVLSAGTDGTDGPTEAAGAMADGETTVRARELGMDAASFLDDNDAYRFFQPLSDLFITGPTNTNVMDLHIFLATLPELR